MPRASATILFDQATTAPADELRALGSKPAAVRITFASKTQPLSRFVRQSITHPGLAAL